MTSPKANLIIEACGAGDIVATIISDDHATELLRITEKPFRGEHLLALLLDTLKVHKLSLDDISQLTVCRGPGSFMTSRIIAVVAMGIAKDKNIPLYGYRHGDDISMAQSIEPFVPLYE